MLVSLTDGRDSTIETLFLEFMNKDQKYHIRGLPNDIDGLLYRAGSKGWIDTKVSPQWLSDKRKRRSLFELPQGRKVIFSSLYDLPQDHKQVILLDNCSGQTSTTLLQEACKRLTRKYGTFHRIQPTLYNLVTVFQSKNQDRMVHSVENL